MIFERLFRPKTRRIELDLTDAQIVQLRAVMDNLPLNPYSGLVAAVLKKLPLESDAAPPNTGADADRQVHPRGPVGGFSLTPITPKGKALLPEVERMLARLPHTGDL